MKIQQLRYVAEIVRQGNHLSAAALALNTSQPGVSRQVQLLEAELGVQIFVRTRNRIIGLTEPGEHVLAIAKRVTSDFNALKSLKMDLESKDSGTFVIATTHTQARYVLPKVIERFIKTYPGVDLVLKQGDPETICQLVEDGDADIAIGPETVRVFPQLFKMTGSLLERVVVGPVDHPIQTVPELTLAAIAQHPIIAYDTRYSGHWRVMDAFRKAGLEPRISFSAIDADVSKTYTALGLGLAILSAVAFDPKQDIGLAARDASHLFAPSITTVSIRPTTYVRPYVLDFLSSFSGDLSVGQIRDAVRAAAVSDMKES